jgi:hypothetical protein
VDGAALLESGRCAAPAAGTEDSRRRLRFKKISKSLSIYLNNAPPRSRASEISRRYLKRDRSTELAIAS